MDQIWTVSHNTGAVTRVKQFQRRISGADFPPHRKPCVTECYRSLVLGKALPDFPEDCSIVANMKDKRLTRSRRLLLSAAFGGRPLGRR